MGFIEREFDRLGEAMMGLDPDDVRWRELYAARSALAWAMDPQGFVAPLDAINGTSAVAPMRDVAAPKDRAAADGPDSRHG